MKQGPAAMPAYNSVTEDNVMAERREGWVRWDYFLLYLQDGSVIHAWYLDPDGSLIECGMVRISGNSRCCISTLRDGYWKLDWGGCLDSPAYKQQKGVLLNA